MKWICSLSLMKSFKHIDSLLVVCLLSIAFGDTIAKASQSGQSSERAQPASRLAHMVEEAARRLGYRSMRGVRVPDQWAEGDNRDLVVDHLYTTLFGKDSDDSCLGTKGRIGVTILVFNDAETARQHLTQTKTYHLGNLGVKMIKSDDQGYLLEEVNGFYAATIAGAKLVLLEDHSRAQRRIIKTLAATVLREMR